MPELKLPLGFERSKYVFKPRICMAVDSAFRKEGKTHFAMTAPAPIVYFSFDKQSREDVMAKFPTKEVYDKSYSAGSRDAEEVIAQVENDFPAVVSAKGVRTIVIDTGSDLYGLIQLKLFKKQTSIPPFRYYEVNQWFNNVIVQPILESDKNLIINYFMGKEYIKVGDKDAWSGEYERKGFRDSDGLMQLNIRLEREKDGLFKATIRNSSQNAATVGMEFRSNPYVPEPSFDMLTGDDETDYAVFADHQCSFPFVAKAIFPNTKLTDWL